MHVILRRAFSVVPRGVGQAAIEMIDKVGLPSPATLSRARFYADVSFMMAYRDRHAAMVSGGAVFFGLLDSSPQGGRNYLMSEYTCVQPGKTSECSSKLFSNGDNLRTQLWQTQFHAVGRTCARVRAV